MTAVAVVESPLIPIAAAVVGYLIGSIPFGLVLTRLAGLGDIRKIGSGNIGATNVLRTGNKTLAALTVILDGGKGALVVIVASLLSPGLAPLVAGVAAVLGHNFPIWLRFKGGKGVATTLGTLLALAWPVGLFGCATWLLVALISRYSSLSALVALALAPIIAWIIDRPDVAGAAAVLAVLSFVRHHENIARLLKGEESKIRLRSDSTG